jgi:hypothetical protein
MPFTLAWAFGFSYDPRNLSVGLMAWAIGCGAGLARLAARWRRPAFALPVPVAPARLRALGLAGAAAAAIAWLAAAALVPDARLLAHARRLQRGLGDPALAGALADLRAEGRLEGKIVADASVLLAYAPEWDARFSVTDVGDSRRLAAAAANPDVRWLALPAGLTPPPRDGTARAAWDWRLQGTYGATALWRLGP